MPKVSVLIPTYNCAKYIGKAVQSVINQTYDDFEIIISDNASTDNTSEIVNQFKDSRIKYYINTENIGYTRNVKKLIDLANGEYCIVLCADDYWESIQLLSEMVRILDENKNIGFVWCNMKILNELTCTISFKDDKKKSHEISIIKGEDYFWGNTRGIVSPQLSCCLFRRELAIRVGAFEETQLRYCPDMVLWLKLSLLSNGCFLNKLYAVYRKSDINQSNQLSFKERFEDELKGISVVVDFAKENGKANVDLAYWAKRIKRSLLIENMRRAFSDRVNKIGRDTLCSLVRITWETDKITFLHPSFLARMLGFLFPIKLLVNIMQFVKYLREYK